MSAETPAGATTTTPPPRTAEAGGEPAVDHTGIAETPEFKALHESRRNFVIGGTLLATAVMLVAFGLIGFAPDAMGKTAIGSVTWALLLGFGLIAFTFAMAWVFARRSVQWDEMAARLVETHDQPSARTGRFER
jgi:uncharacterized membrane protein (DUF485 family)